MPTYFASQLGDDTTGTSWRTAKRSLQAAIALATVNNDIVALDAVNVPTVDAEMAANTTYTFSANVNLLASMPGSFTGTDTTLTPARMADLNTWIGCTTATVHRYVRFSRADGRLFIYGIRFRSVVTGTASAPVASGLSYVSGQSTLFQACDFSWSKMSSGTVVCAFADAAATAQFLDCTFTIDQGASNNYFLLSGATEFTNTTVTISGPTSVFAGGADPGTSYIVGCVFNGGTYLLGNCGATVQVFADRCVVPAGLLAPQTSNPTQASGRVFASWCGTAFSDPALFAFQYADAIGSAFLDTTTYYSGTAYSASWQVTTTSLCEYNQPFNTPWIGAYVPAPGVGGKQVTPTIQVLSNQTFTDQQLWGSFTVKTNTIVGGGGRPAAVRYNDRALFATPPAAQTPGDGVGAWTQALATPVSQKVNSLIALSIPEGNGGYIRARVSVALPSVSNLYIDPQIRGL